jgi:hypothetical protein
MYLDNIVLQLRDVPDVETPRSKHGNTPRIELAVWILIGLTSTLVPLRVCYRMFRARLRLWADDYFLVAALVSTNKYRFTEIWLTGLVVSYALLATRLLLQNGFQTSFSPM